MGKATQDLRKEHEAILYVLDKFSKYKFILDKINQSNPLANMLQDGIDSIKITEMEKECVYVPTNNGSTSFYESLSKSARQNYRTAKNRLKNQKISKSVIFFLVTTGSLCILQDTYSKIIRV